MKQNIQRELTDAGIAILTFDRPDSPANFFDQRTLDELNAHLDFLESEKSVQGLIIRSAKSKIFIAGADLNAFTQEISAERIARVIEQGQKTCERIARLPYPTVATIHGVALGGGFEIALACDYRIASSDSVTKVGLPETNLGILPAWGGCTRLPKLIGLPNALEAILNGRQYPAEQALEAGMVDSIVHREQLITAGTKKIQQSGNRKRPEKLHLSNRAPLSRVVQSQAEKKVLARTRGHYPAPLKALEVASASLKLSQEESLANEKNKFIELALGETAQNLIGIFFLQERAKKLKLPKEFEIETSAPVKALNRCLIVGAGLMGAGVAQWLSSRGIWVILKDIGPEPLGKAMQSVAKTYGDAVKRHLLSETDARNAFDRVLPVYEEIPLREVDLVLEAAIEKLDLKQQIFADIESKVPPDLVLASNTSALSIDAIAASLQHPERVVGFHFFNPVHRMQLVEIVRGAKTNPATLNTAIRFAKQIGKLPVLVKDSPGFLVNRILLPYMVEAVRLFSEGYRIEKIDRVMLDFGMPMGPLRLSDEVGLDVAEHVAKELVSRLRHLAPLNDTLGKMIANRWLGRKSGKGFYEYGGAEKVNAQLGDLQSAEPTTVNEGDLRDRLVLSMINEAARTLEEKVVDSPEDVDFGMIMGTGWAPFRGGPLRFADHLGIATVVSRLNNLRDRVAQEFAPCSLLADMANRGASFYPQTKTTPSTESEPRF